MTRIFLTLASLNAAALLASFGLGLYYTSAEEAAAIGRASAGVQANWHFIVGLGAVILTLFVHCLIFTYFLGTGRWVKEVARAYRIPDEPLPRLTREFKRRAFPPALFAMLAGIATAASGGAAQFQDWPWWTHTVLAILTIVINGYAYVVEYRTVEANGRVIEQIMGSVRHESRG